MSLEEVRYKRMEIEAAEATELQLYKKNKNLIELFIDESKRHNFRGRFATLTFKTQLLSIQQKKKTNHYFCCSSCLWMQ